MFALAWLPALAYPGGRLPWAETAEDIAIHKLESAYDAHSAEVLREWDLSQRSREELSASRAPRYQNVWTVGSLVADEVVGTASAGAGLYAHVSVSCWFHGSWVHVDLLPNDHELGVERCSLYSSLPRPLQSVQRAEMCGVVLALQATSAVHLGVDNLNVVRHVSRILALSPGIRPFELFVDGDLVSLIANLLRKWGSDTVQITKAKGDADDDMVRTGKVRALGKACNDFADKVADFGRRRLPAEVIDARRCYLAACSDWYPLVYDLHRYFIAIARAVVNEDGYGGSAPHPIVWDRERQPKRIRALCVGNSPT